MIRAGFLGASVSTGAVELAFQEGQSVLEVFLPLWNDRTPYKPAEAYLHMRSLGHGGARAAAIMYHTDGRGPACFSGQDRPFARARQER